ncbi:hypothetical protein ACSBR1_032227 [Camellia fascicularis]
MIMDYGQFGDVVTFDTTYKLNSAHRLFESFVGFNHHKETVICVCYCCSQVFFITICLFQCYRCIPSMEPIKHCLTMQAVITRKPQIVPHVVK